MKCGGHKKGICDTVELRWIDNATFQRSQTCQRRLELLLIHDRDVEYMRNKMGLRRTLRNTIIEREKKKGRIREDVTYKQVARFQECVSIQVLLQKMSGTTTKYSCLKNINGYVEDLAGTWVSL